MRLRGGVCVPSPSLSLLPHCGSRNDAANRARQARQRSVSSPQWACSRRGVVVAVVVVVVVAVVARVVVRMLGGMGEPLLHLGDNRSAQTACFLQRHHCARKKAEGSRKTRVEHPASSDSGRGAHGQRLLPAIGLGAGQSEDGSRIPSCRVTSLLRFGVTATKRLACSEPALRANGQDGNSRRQ